MTNIEKVQDGYAAFGRGDLEAAMAAFADEVAWRGLDPATPGTGHASTREGVIAELSRVPEGYERFEPMPERFHALEDGVLVEGTLTIQPHGATEPAVSPYLHRYRFEDGRVVASTFGVA